MREGGREGGGVSERYRQEGRREGGREGGREVRTRTSVRTLLSPVRLRTKFSFFTTRSRIFSRRAWGGREGEREGE